jgi:hypothetical protein
MSDTILLLCGMAIGSAFTAAAFITSRERKAGVQAGTEGRSVHDVWTGRCYKCGEPVADGDLVRVNFGSKPPKHFHKWCWITKEQTK